MEYTTCLVLGNIEYFIVEGSFKRRSLDQFLVICALKLKLSKLCPTTVLSRSLLAITDNGSSRTPSIGGIRLLSPNNSLGTGIIIFDKEISLPNTFFTYNKNCNTYKSIWFTYNVIC